MLSPLRRSLRNTDLGEWLDPKSLLGNERVCEQRVQLIKSDLQHELKIELDKNNELSTLLMLLASDAKKMKTNANQIISQYEKKIQELIDEVQDKECRLHELHLDLEIVVNQNHQLLEDELKNKSLISQLQSEISSLEASLELRQRQYLDLETSLNRKVESLHEEIAALGRLRDEALSHLASTEDALQVKRSELISSVKARAAAAILSSLQQIQVRISYKAFGRWLSLTSYKTASQKLEKLLHLELVSMQNQCASSVQQLEERHRIELEDHRRKYTRVLDSRNGLVYELIRAKKHVPHFVLSNWKSRFIRSIYERCQVEKTKTSRLLRDFKEAVDTNKRTGGKIIKLICNGYDRYCLSTFFRRWEKQICNLNVIQGLKSTLQIQSLNHERLLIQMQDALSQLNSKYEGDKRKWEARAVAISSLEEHLSAEMQELKRAIASISRRKPTSFEDTVNELLAEREKLINDLQEQNGIKHVKITETESELQKKTMSLISANEKIEDLQATIDKMIQEKSHMEGQIQELQWKVEKHALDNMEYRNNLSSSESLKGSDIIKDLAESRAKIAQLQDTVEHYSSQLSLSQHNCRELIQKLAISEKKAEALEETIAEYKVPRPVDMNFNRSPLNADRFMNFLSVIFSMLEIICHVPCLVAATTSQSI